MFTSGENPRLYDLPPTPARHNTNETHYYPGILGGSVDLLFSSPLRLLNTQLGQTESGTHGNGPDFKMNLDKMVYAAALVLFDVSDIVEGGLAIVNDAFNEQAPHTPLEHRAALSSTY